MTKPTLHTNILHHIFESSSQATIVMNNEMVVTNSNIAAQSLFGYSQKELESKCVYTLIPELAKNNTPKTHQSIEGLWILKKDGSQSLVNVRLNSIANKEGFDTVLFIQDTTEGLVYQWALEGSLKELSHIESEGNLGNWYWVFDTDERYWSDEFYRICGLLPGDDRLNGDTLLSFIHPDDRNIFMAVVNQSIEKNIPYSIEKRIIQPNGSLRNVVARGKVHYNTAGNPVRMSGTMRDITVLKNKQVALLESKRKYKTLINNLNGIVYSCEYNLEYTMNYISDGCYAITGYTSDEFLDGSIHFGTIILEEDRLYAWNEVKKALSEKKHFDVQYRIKCKKGGIKYVREIGCGVFNKDSTHIVLEGFITDETEKNKTQEILKIRNRALEAAGSGIIIVDAQKPNLPIVYCNQSFTTITGYEKEEVLGRNCQFLQSDDKDQPQIKIMSMAIHQGEPCRVTLRNYRKDGVQFWNDVSITAIKNESGTTTHFIGVQNDITKQKNAEKKLFDSEARNTAILKALPDLLFVLNKQGVYLDVHAQDTSLLAVPKSEIIGKNMFDILPKKVCKKIMVAFKNSQKTKEIQVLEYSLLINKQLKHFEARIVITDIDTFLTIVRDISREKIIKKELKKSQEQLKLYAKDLEEKVKERTREVVATIEQLVATNLHLEDQIKETQTAEKSAIASKSLSLAIAKNFPNGFIIVFNADFEIILKEGEAIDELGLKNVTFEGMYIDDIMLFTEEQKGKLKENVLKTMKGEHLSFEMQYKDKYFSVNTTPLVNENGVLLSALFVYNDISKQKRLELDAQNALKKEQELNELKSRFISMASHEFRTPLAAIQTSAILIARQNEPGKEEKREKYVKQIKNNIKNLEVILNDFLSLSKLEEGKVIANNEVFDLVNFCKNLLEEVVITTKKGQQIKFFASDTSFLLHLDPKLMRHILMNLLSNAIKYSPENTIINFNIDQDEHCVILSVSDQGIGIPEDEQKNLFERFFRAKNAYNIEGTGLGLNIVKQYVELMSGNVGFTSEENKGTTFWIKWLKPTKE